MCNLYSLTKGQAATRDWFRAPHDRTGNLPLFPGIFPDQTAPIVRAGEAGEREFVMARWGMPGPPQYGGAPVTNIRNVSSPHWRGWLGKRNRCIVPATSFCEHEAPQDADLVCPWRGSAALRLRGPMGFLARRARPEERSGRGPA
jgi:putative SOS response-associated peptidase YedK